ncbi:MAG: peptidoglycan DD-metalloendopeptidase family protein [Lachnospiraceae bacterium]|nr:peptidoglycan DD-metalloendopeptidase family protein [Lachnospiraceae bacterium]
MNRRTWKEFITKRSTIWTLSLCLVGAVVLGGLAAVNSSRREDDAQPETGTGQVAYLEEDLDSTDDDSHISADASDDTDSILADAADTSGSVLSNTADDTEEISGNTSNENTFDAEAEDALEDTSSAEESSVITNANDSTSDSLSGSDMDVSANAALSTADTASSSANADDSADISSSGTDANSAAESADDSANTAADAAETTSANIISEQALLEAGVSFSDEQSLLWPSAGTITIDYSMDKSVYFATLNQYKYNPALIISSETGNQVLASAKGIVESITIDEETGTTLVLNIGNGYKLTYGQLMEPAVSEGDVVEAGDLLAYISEPTKYYSIEGSSLYFAMTKDGEPVDPVLYLE